jgi:hypothetical protein
MYRQLQIKISFPHARSWASFPTIPRCGSRLIARNVCLALRTWGRSTDLVTNLLSRTKILLCPDIQDLLGQSQSRFRRGAADKPAFRNGPPHLSHTPARRRPQTLVGPAAPRSPFSQKFRNAFLSLHLNSCACHQATQRFFCQYEAFHPWKFFFPPLSIYSSPLSLKESLSVSFTDLFFKNACQVSDTRTGTGTCHASLRQMAVIILKKTQEIIIFF